MAIMDVQSHIRNILRSVLKGDDIGRLTGLCQGYVAAPADYISAILKLFKEDVDGSYTMYTDMLMNYKAPEEPKKDEDVKVHKRNRH